MGQCRPRKGRRPRDPCTESTGRHRKHAQHRRCRCGWSLLRAKGPRTPAPADPRGGGEVAASITELPEESMSHPSLRDLAPGEGPLEQIFVRWRKGLIGADVALREAASPEMVEVHD